MFENVFFELWKSVYLFVEAVACVFFVHKNKDLLLKALIVFKKALHKVTI